MLNPSLSDVLDVALEGALADVHTAMPGTIVSYDAGSRRASVQPLLQRAYFDEDGNRQVERYPILPSVPVVMPGNSSVGLVWTVKPGDRVLIVFAEASLNQWLAQDSEGDPLDERRHSLSDGVAIAGLGSSGTITDDVGDALVLHGDDIKLGSKDADKQAAHVPGVVDGLISVLSDPSVVGALKTLMDAIAAFAPPLAIAVLSDALRLTMETHFATTPMPGADKVQVE